MTQEEMLDRMPCFAQGTLPPQEAMAIARALKDDARLLEELMFCLRLKEVTQSWEIPPPRMAPLPLEVPVSDSLLRGADMLKSALRTVGSSLRLAGKMI